MTEEMKLTSELMENDPYSEGMRRIDKYQAEEWAYDHGYDSGIEPLYQIMPTDLKTDLGHILLAEGEDHAREFINEEITEIVDRTTNEYLKQWVDDQMMVYAGYRLDTVGNTIEEGEYGTWEDLRIAWECGFRDKLRNNERYESLPESF